MPIYAYRCRNCGEKFESLRGINDSDTGVACPKCGVKNPQRVLAPVCGITSRTTPGTFRPT
jgi:putative FmdB family regulatory protein